MSASGAIFLDVQELVETGISKAEIVATISFNYGVSEDYVKRLIESVSKELG